MVIDHVDGNKENNNVENLNVVTQKENIARYWDRMNQKGTKIVSVSIPEKLIRDLDTIKTETKKTRSMIYAEALEKFVEENREEKK